MTPNTTEILNQQAKFLAHGQIDVLDLLFSTFQVALKKSRELEQKERELKEAMRMISELKEIIHACAHCKRIRDDDQWRELEDPFENIFNASYSHTVCPECVEAYYPDFKKKVVNL
jgi:Leu/Phe-tRNA-protein transferase